MVEYLRYFADFKNWLYNLTCRLQRQDLSYNVLQVLGRSIQKIYGRFILQTSQNIDLQVNFSTESLKKWITDYYKIESISFTLRDRTKWLTSMNDVDYFASKDIQHCNITDIRNNTKCFYPINMFDIYSIHAEFFANDVDILIIGKLSQKQQNDIVRFVLLRTTKKVGFTFQESVFTNAVCFVYLKSTKQLIQSIDVRDSDGTFFINDVIETDPTVTSTYLIVKKGNMTANQITGNGILTTFTIANPHNTANILIKAKYNATGQYIEPDYVVNASTITISTGNVPIPNNIVIDILTTV